MLGSRSVVRCAQSVLQSKLSLKMGQATNEFNTSSVLVKFPMKVLNHTKEALLTTTEATHSVKQVTTVELGSGDIFSQLGYGHCTYSIRKCCKQMSTLILCFQFRIQSPK